MAWRRRSYFPICSGFSRRQVSHLKGYLFTGLVIFIIAIVLIVAEQRLKPSFLKIAEVRADQVATEMINRAINEKIAHSIRYRDLVHIVRDENNKITVVEQNTGEISRLITDVTLEVQNGLNTMAEEPIQIPLGQVLGSELLAAFGPQITVKVVPAGVVESRIMDKVETSGINQVRHKIYVSVEATVRVVIPLLSTDVNVKTEVPLTDFSIVGEVPQFYFQLDGGTGYGQ